MVVFGDRPKARETKLQHDGVINRHLQGTADFAVAIGFGSLLEPSNGGGCSHGLRFLPTDAVEHLYEIAVDSEGHVDLLGLGRGNDR